MCAGSIEYAIVRDRVIAIDASEMQVCAHCLGIDCICTGDRSAGSMHICRIESSCVRDRMCTGSSHTPACGIYPSQLPRTRTYGSIEITYDKYD